MAGDPEVVARYTAGSAAIHNEDITVCEGIQRGVQSPFYIPGPLSHLEASLLRFHLFLKARLAAET
jgi:hypothetical protein